MTRYFLIVCSEVEKDFFAKFDEASKKFFPIRLLYVTVKAYDIYFSFVKQRIFSHKITSFFRFE